MGTAPSISRRALAAALAPALAGLLSGCGVLNVSQGELDVVIKNKDEAAAHVAGELEKCYGARFELVSRDDAWVDTTGRVLTYEMLFAPEGDRGRVFGAFVRADVKSGHAVGSVESDYSQYLFKERAEAPFRSALAGLEGLAGWAARLTKARFASKPWHAEDFDAYMGSGGMRDPSVEVVLMMPRGRSVEEWAETAAPCFKSLYGLKRSMEVVVGLEGADFRKSPLRPMDVDEADPNSRRPAPSAESLAEDFGWLSDDELSPTGPKAVPWDGNGNPDRKPQDPGSTSAYPTVHWNPGHGPSAW